MTLSDKPLLTEHQRRIRQRTAAHFGEATAAIGLTALAARGGAGVLRAVKRGDSIAKPLTKIPKIRAMSNKQLKTSANKLERASGTLGVGSVGLGAASSLNGARLSYDASRRHNMNVGKSMTHTMDFGAHQDSHGSRERFMKETGDASSDSDSGDSGNRRSAGVASGSTPVGKALGFGALGRANKITQAAEKLPGVQAKVLRGERPMGPHATPIGPTPGSRAQAKGRMKPIAPTPRHAAPGMSNTKKFAIGGAGAGGLGAGLGAYAYNRSTTSKSMEISKDWTKWNAEHRKGKVGMNIEEHKQRGIDARKKKRRAGGIASTGVTAGYANYVHNRAATAPGTRSGNYRRMFSSPTGGTTQGQRWMKFAQESKKGGRVHALSNGNKVRAAGKLLKADPHAPAALVAGGLIAGGYAAGMHYNRQSEAHKKAISQQRYANAKKKRQQAQVHKAFDNHPKVKGQHVIGARQVGSSLNLQGQSNDTAVISSEGKSAVLRRPKYNLTTMPTKGTKNRPTHIIGARSLGHMSGDDKRAVQSAYRGNKKKLNFQGNSYAVHKAFAMPDKKKQQAGLNIAGGAALGATLPKAAGKTKAGNIVLNTSKLKTKGGKAGLAVGLAGVGSLVAANRMNSYGGGKGGLKKITRPEPYNPLYRPTR